MVAMPHMVKKIIKMEKRERGQKERKRAFIKINL